MSIRIIITITDDLQVTLEGVNEPVPPPKTIPKKKKKKGKKR